MKARAWSEAAAAYSRLLELYPDDSLAPSARIASAAASERTVQITRQPSAIRSRASRRAEYP